MRIAVAGGTSLVGRYVVDSAEASGHQVVILSRSHDVDLRSGQGLDSALDGVNAIIDVTNPSSGDVATDFFAAMRGPLHSAGAARQIRHMVTLLIVGMECAPENTYYAAKLRQEQIALRGSVPATILRATPVPRFSRAQDLRRTAVRPHPQTSVKPGASRSTGATRCRPRGPRHPVGTPGSDLSGPSQDQVAVHERSCTNA